MTRPRTIPTIRALGGALVLGALLGAAPQADPEPFPYHQPLALATVAVDPEPFPWQTVGRVKVRYPWLPADGAADLV